MQSKILLSSILLLFSTGITVSQDWSSQEWVVKLIQSNTDSGTTSANNVPHILENEMKSFIGTKAQNITFRPIKNWFFSDDLESYKGNMIIVQFGGTTCSGCKMQMPELSRIQDSYGKQHVKVLFLFLEQQNILKKYFENQSISGVIATVEETHLLKPFQLIAMPTAYIIDANGIIRDCWVVPEKYDSIEKRLQRCLAEAM